MNLLKSIFFGFLLITAFSALGKPASADKHNVLFIAVDDLNHWVSHLGRNSQALSLIHI